MKKTTRYAIAREKIRLIYLEDSSCFYIIKHLEDSRILKKYMVIIDEKEFYKSHFDSYLISKCGLVASYKYNRYKIMQGKLDKDGYALVNIKSGGKFYYKSIHRMVAIAFIPNPENKPCVNHKNGIRNDNRLENLEWCTHSENMLHSFKVLKRKPNINQAK